MEWDIILYMDDQLRVQLRDLKKVFGDEDISVLNRLISLGFIKEFEAPVEDFNNYIITAKGMEAARLLRERNKIEKKLDGLWI